MYSYGPPHMAEQKQDDQLEHTYSSYVSIRDVALKTCRRRWTIGRSGERGSGISVLAARHDDDDDDEYIYMYIYIYICVCVWHLLSKYSLSTEWSRDDLDYIHKRCEQLNLLNHLCTVIIPVNLVLFSLSVSRCLSPFFSFFLSFFLSFFIFFLSFLFYLHI